MSRVGTIFRSLFFLFSLSTSLLGCIEENRVYGILGFDPLELQELTNKAIYVESGDAIEMSPATSATLAVIRSKTSLSQKNLSPFGKKSTARLLASEVSFQCYFDQTIDDNVSETQSCSEIMGVSFSHLTGEFYWLPDSSQVGKYEFLIKATLNTRQNSKLVQISIKGQPSASLRNDSTYVTGDSQPELLLNGDFEVGQTLSIYRDATCQQKVGELAVSSTANSYQLVPIDELAEGNYEFYVQETTGGLTFPCLNKPIPYSYKTAKKTVTIVSNNSAFAALKTDGSVVTWGDSIRGGDSSSVSASLTSGVTQIFSATSAFAALKTDGSVITWGVNSFGGNSSSGSASLASGVTQIFSTE
jgi:hypothetical protein